MVLVALMALGVRCWNWERVFREDGVYFVDADCYSRMERVEAVLASPGRIVAKHEFENYPIGTQPHTTAPMDYLIATVACALRPLSSAYRDLAGAWVSPLIGFATVLFLFAWARSAKLSPWGMLLVFTLSPIAAHGTVLGRPDHQGLVLFLMSVAFGAEWMLVQKGTRFWGVLGGLAWGTGLWVSLYEPGILFAITQLLGLVFLRKGFFCRNRLWSWITLLTLLAVALLLEGWRMEIPGGELFERWAATIGEMRPSPALLFRWTGWGLLLAPLLLCLRKQTVPLCLLLLITTALALQHARWGYFMALVFAMTLPFLFALAHRRWLAWTLFGLSLWPVAREWDQLLFAETASLRTFEQQQLREVAVALQAEGQPGGILAPWWFSPALSYWSGKPAVAGSSHQSLPGISDSARFFMETEPARARALLIQRDVGWVVAIEPELILANSAALLGKQIPRGSMAELLFNRPSMAPGFLRLDHGNQFFKAYRVLNNE